MTVEKKGYLKKAEARSNGFFIKGEKVKGANLSKEFCDAWNGVKKAAPAPVEVAAEETEAAVETVKKAFGGKKSK